MAATIPGTSIAETRITWTFVAAAGETNINISQVEWERTPCSRHGFDCSADRGVRGSGLQSAWRKDRLHGVRRRHLHRRGRQCGRHLRRNRQLSADVGQAVRPFVVPTKTKAGPMANGVVYPGGHHQGRSRSMGVPGDGRPAIVNQRDGAWRRLGLLPVDPAVRAERCVPRRAHSARPPRRLNLAAPTTGLYSVVVASADGTYTAAGNYSLTATGIAAPPAVDLGDIAVDFGASYGL